MTQHAELLFLKSYACSYYIFTSKKSVSAKHKQFDQTEGNILCV